MLWEHSDGRITYPKGEEDHAGMELVNQGLENEADLARLWRDRRNSRERKQLGQKFQVHLCLDTITLSILAISIVKVHFSFLKHLCLSNM